MFQIITVRLTTSYLLALNRVFFATYSLYLQLKFHHITMTCISYSS